ncbi:Flp pilus assembly complex ATPase component TadA [Paenibacillus sp. 481]|nr:Flp pilus assembly complex ATPase component TadA [Paenibacillus sp. 481]
MIVIAAGWFIWRWRQTRRQRISQPDHHWTWDKLDTVVRESFQSWTSEPVLDYFADDEKFKREYQRRLALKQALKGCCSGDPADKEFIKDVIVDMLVKHVKLSANQMNQLIDFEQPAQLSATDKFDLLLFGYKCRCGYDALHELIQAYSWDELKKLDDLSGKDEQCYVITVQDVEIAFRQERFTFTNEEKLAIIAQRLYQRFKGFSVIDEIRDMCIDGVSGGVNGITGHVRKGTVPIYAHDSVWIFYRGKSIRLAFLSFGSERELKRVCHNIYKYGAPGPLTEADGYRVNDMKDGSRVVVLRPPFSESWAFFVRKFDAEHATLEHLITDRNAEIPIRLLQFMMKGARITAITGAQGSGKTTMLMALVQSIYSFHTLRVQEQAFELNLRRIYPDRNILTLRETERITGQAGLDVQKKTDGTVHILGEVATDPIAAWMVQMAQVASLFTVFTHHAKTFSDLVFSLRNSLLKTGMFHNEQVAEQQVVNVIHFDIHLARSADGKRYIERITECIPIEAAAEDFALLDQAEQGEQGANWGQFIHTTASAVRHFTRSRKFQYRNIVEYRNGSYIWVNSLTAGQVADMATHMTALDKQRFYDWLAQEGRVPVSA